METPRMAKVEIIWKVVVGKVKMTLKVMIMWMNCLMEEMKMVVKKVISSDNQHYLRLQPLV